MREIGHNRCILPYTSDRSDLTDDKTTLPPSIRDSTVEEFKLKLVNQESEIVSLTSMIPESQRSTPHPPAPPLLSEDGLIIPRKLHNPVLDSTDRQNLHRELLFNQKIGKNVLNQKSELQKALEKHKTNVAKKQYENNKLSRAAELEKVIADRAKRQQETIPQIEDDKSLNKEFIQARAKLKTRTESK
ncbi:hypothetical protein Trydic_g13051 [Trypoxylus dichotomus]